MASAIEIPGNVQKPKLADHDSSVLDLAFALDCTSSMGSYIKIAQNNIRSITENIVAAEKSDIQLALVQYRDHPPQDSSFVTKVLDFTKSVGSMKRTLDACTAQGGGDGPEAVADALYQISKLSWRPAATKICIFITDAPPHGLERAGDGFPNGCPDGLDPVTITRQLAQRGVTLYSVGCEPSINRYKEFYSALAHMTGGQYVPLGNASLLSKVIIGGAQEEITLEKLMEEVNEDVMQEMSAAGEEGLKEEELISRVYFAAQARGARAKQLKRKRGALPGASARAKEYAEMCNFSDLGTAWLRDQKEPESTKSWSAVSRGLRGSLRGGYAVRGGRGGRGAPLMKKCKRKRSRSRSRDRDEPSTPMNGESSSDEFETHEEEVTLTQVSRMVQKSMARQGLKWNDK